MKRTIALNLILASSLAVSACSFQKNPNKLPPATPEPVKVGMTKDELQKEISESQEITFPDKVLLADKKGDEDLVYRLFRDASADDLNQYGVGGFTAMELLVKVGRDGLLVDALKKGGSIYKFRKGTKYRVISIFEETPENKLVLAKAALPKAQMMMKEATFDSLISPGSFLHGYWRTHYPILQSTDGKTLLEQIVRFKDVYLQSALENERPHSWASMLNFVEKVEGPIKSGLFDLLLFFVEVRDPYSVQFILDRMEHLTNEQRVKVLDSVKYPTIEYLRQLEVIFSLNEDELKRLEVKAIEELNAIEAKKLKAIYRNINRWDINDYAAAAFPSLYVALKEKLKDLNYKIDERAAGIGGIDKYDFRYLSCPKLYEALVEDEREVYLKCEDIYNTTPGKVPGAG